MTENNLFDKTELIGLQLYQIIKKFLRFCLTYRRVLGKISSPTKQPADNQSFDICYKTLFLSYDVL